MKRFFPLFLALTMVFALTGCELIDKILDREEEEEFDVEECLEEAEELVEEGDLEEAEKLLKRGIRKAEDPEELEAYLEIVLAMQGEQPHKETMDATTAPATEATQQPQTSEQPQTPEQPTGVNLLTGFDSEQTYQINVFLSNFSEQGFVAYPCSEFDLIDFGYIYAKINNREVLGVDGYYYYVTKPNMDSILTRFFGSTVTLTDPTTLTGPYSQTVEFRGGTYYFPAADGEGYAYCSVATNMTANTDGTYTVSFDVYAHENPHDSMSPYYSMTPSQISGRSELTYQYSGTAVVRDYLRSNGAESYQLIRYQKN